MPEFPCERLLKIGWIGDHNGFKEVGKEKWLLEQEEKAEKGYDPHTKKYYR